MTTPDLAATPAAIEVTAAAPGLAGACWLLGATFLALLAVYFIGLDKA